jgi:hypothetical protein
MKFIIPPITQEQRDLLRNLLAERVCADGEKAIDNIAGRKKMLAEIKDAAMKKHTQKTFEMMNEQELQDIFEFSNLLQIVADARADRE